MMERSGRGKPAEARQNDARKKRAPERAGLSTAFGPPGKWARRPSSDLTGRLCSGAAVL